LGKIGAGHCKPLKAVCFFALKSLFLSYLSSLRTHLKNDMKKRNLLDTALIAIIEQKNKLASLDYNDPLYDEVENKLHEIEDAFVEHFGEELEEIIEGLYELHHFQGEVLSPISYLARKYQVEKTPKETRYAAVKEDALQIDAQNHLVLLPMPPRICLLDAVGNSVELWADR
jgi:hypothetical protein